MAAKKTPPKTTLSKNAKPSGAKKTSTGKAESTVKKKTASAAKTSSAPKTAAGKKRAAAQKSPAKNGSGKSSAKAPTVVNSVSAAAKRIQEREARRKKKASERLAKSTATATPRKTNGHPIGAPKTPKAGKPLTKRDLEKFKNLLLELRDRIVGDIEFLTTDNLHRVGRDTGADLSGSSQHSADHGTDNFDREFALSLATSEQDVLYEVDEALMRIQEGTYGICEMSGVRIEKARLQVIPYTRFSVQAQTKMEQGRAKYRPFAQAFKSW